MTTEIRPDEISSLIEQRIKNFKSEAKTEEVGTIVEVGDGIARVYGLDNALAGELVQVENGVTGMVLNLEVDNVGVVLFGSDQGIKEGDTIRCTGEILSVPAGESLLGRVVDPLGEPIDGKGPLTPKPTETRRIESVARGIVDRQPVKEPLQTGLKAIDSMVPIGRGQRDLIIGDRQTGKTAVAVDAIINQKGKNM
ncbi:MAG: F0F1 ATP synthase subunit alpha, partial [Candidatus Omnitrophica bacterium]|nr:F0F1 ATP synthase subunit alpha [Candidatus Omnitrophota bacterium]